MTESSGKTYDEENRGRGLPRTLKWGLIAVLGIVSVFVIWQYIAYVYSPTTGASPSELGLPTLFVFSITGLFLVLIPLERMGLRLKKVGWLEFETIVATQAAEHAEDLAEIEERLTSIETNLMSSDESLQLAQIYHEPDIRDLLLIFFTDNDKIPYSPLRIRRWASQHEGFRLLKDIDPAVLRSILRKLVAEGVLETRVSKKGNTLYLLRREMHK